ncbi:hypothetical protein Q7I26_07095 [Aeromonas veronii]
MEKVIFKRAALSAAVVAALVAPGMALAAQDMMSPEYGQSYETFVKDSKLTGGLVIPPFFGALKSRGHAACAKRCFGV